MLPIHNDHDFLFQLCLTYVSLTTEFQKIKVYFLFVVKYEFHVFIVHVIVIFSSYMVPILYVLNCLFIQISVRRLVCLTAVVKVVLPRRT